MLAIAAIIIGSLAYTKCTRISKKIAASKNFKMPATSVSTIEAKASTWQPALHAVGSLKAVQGVDVTTDLGGIVREINFESGTTVEKGQLLVKLDTVQEEAQLRQAEASLALAKTNLARQRDLLARKATSQSDFDSASANADESQASVEQYKALIARKTLQAPFSGVLGIRQVNVGQYLDPGKAVVSLQSQDPIYAEFSIPQQELPKVTLSGEVHILVDGFEGKTFEGKITAINSKIDEATRNIQVEATLSNKEGLLRPGMYAKVDVLLPQKDGVISIPATAVNYAPYGDSVFLVKDGETEGTKIAVQQFIKIGPSRGDQVAVTSGLKEGDVVVTSGGFKLNSGAEIEIHNEVLPSNEANPHPPDT